MSMYNPCAECLNRYGHDYGPECDDRCLYAKALKAEPHYDEWCVDCKEYDHEKNCCPRFNRVIRNTVEEIKAEPCEDAVSREAAIQAMYDLCDTGETLTENQWRDNPHIDAVIDAINELPSVRPERPKGEWIESEFDESVYCSECNAEFESKYNFCPNCGAGLRGGGNV